MSHRPADAVAAAIAHSGNPFVIEQRGQLVMVSLKSLEGEWCVRFLPPEVVQRMAAELMVAADSVEIERT